VKRGGPYFILMLSVRILGGEGWHLFTSGSLAFPPPPFYAASLFYAFAKYCILLFFNNLFKKKLLSLAKEVLKLGMSRPTIEHHKKHFRSPLPP
jgi:hypothetical protein